MTPTKEEMIAFLKANAARTFIEDTGMSIMYAQPDGLWESMYSREDEEEDEEDEEDEGDEGDEGDEEEEEEEEKPEWDPVADFEACDDEVGYLVDSWENVDESQLAEAYQAVLKTEETE